MAKVVKFSDKFIEQACDMFKLLSDKTRLRIFIRLMAQEHSVTELCKALKLPQPTVSHHLSILADAGFLTREQRGKWAWFAIVPERVAMMQDALSVS